MYHKMLTGVSRRPEVPKFHTQRLSPRPFPFSLEMTGGLASAVDAEEAADAIAVPLGAAELPGRVPGPSPSPLRSPPSMLVTDVSGEPRFSGISSRMMTAALGAAADAAVAGPAPSVADSEGKTFVHVVRQVAFSATQPHSFASRRRL